MPAMPPRTNLHGRPPKIPQFPPCRLVRTTTASPQGKPNLPYFAYGRTPLTHPPDWPYHDENTRHENSRLDPSDPADDTTCFYLVGCRILNNK